MEVQSCEPSLLIHVSHKEIIGKYERTTTPLYNSRIIKNYVEYLKSYYPNIDIASLLKYAGIETYQLDDEGHWLTQEQVDRFHEMLAEKTNNPDIAREVGRFSVTSQASGAVRQYLLGFISPATAYAVVEKLNCQIHSGDNS